MTISDGREYKAAISHCFSKCNNLCTFYIKT